MGQGAIAGSNRSAAGYELELSGPTPAELQARRLQGGDGYTAAIAKSTDAGATWETIYLDDTSGQYFNQVRSSPRHFLQAATGGSELKLQILERTDTRDSLRHSLSMPHARVVSIKVCSWRLQLAGRF